MEEYFERLIREIKQTLGKISSKEIEEFIEVIKSSRRIYLAGAGRSGLVAKAFAMRLVHLGKRIFVVGETVVPAMRKSIDTLIVVSGSGKTKSILEIAKTAKEIGGRLVAVTADKSSPLAKIANHIVYIPSGRTKFSMDSYDSRQLLGGVPITPLGSLFELSAFLFFESIVHRLMKDLKITEEKLKKIHTTLE